MCVFAGIAGKYPEQAEPASVKIPVNLQCPPSNHDVNDAIEKTMRSLAELDVSGNSTSSAFSEADAENQTNAERIQNVQRVNAFHDYCAVENGTDMDGQMEEDEPRRNEGEEENSAVNHDAQWKALWDEHYQEMYWYYFSKYQEFIPTEEGWVPRVQAGTQDTDGDVLDNEEGLNAEIDNNDCDKNIDAIPEQTDTTMPYEMVENEASEDDGDDDEDNNEPSDGGGGRKGKRGRKTANQSGKGLSTPRGSEVLFCDRCSLLLNF